MRHGGEDPVTAFPGSFIAVDWGTTNRRVFRIDDGNVVATSRDSQGVTSLTRDAYPAEIAAIRARFGDLPILLAGMVGSTIGWREIPYVSAPAGFAALAGGLGWIDARTAIAVGGGYPCGDSLLCQPGTHCKWVRMARGEIADFTTAMTGELFALLRGHGLLAAQLTADVTAGSAFREGVEAGKARDLAASLFGIRAAKLLGRRGDADAASYASGLLIGSDVAARTGASGDVHVLADPALGELYAIAI
eukprot:gene2338-3157_t